jgi:hypothetical protein
MKRRFDVKNGVKTGSPAFFSPVLRGIPLKPISSDEKSREFTKFPLLPYQKKGG